MRSPASDSSSAPIPVASSRKGFSGMDGAYASANDRLTSANLNDVRTALAPAPFLPFLPFLPTVLLGPAEELLLGSDSPCALVDNRQTSANIDDRRTVMETDRFFFFDPRARRLVGETASQHHGRRRGGKRTGRRWHCRK